MSIYHLHIPRTSGVFVREIMVKGNDQNNFLGHTQKLPESFEGFENVSGHFATTPISELDKSFAIIRQPVDLTVSYITYMRDSFYPESTFDEIISFYIKTGLIENFININLKFLTGTINKEKYNTNIENLRVVAESGWYVENYSLDLEAAKKIIKSNSTELIDFKDDKKHQAVAAMYGKSYENVILNNSYKRTGDNFKKYYDYLAELNEKDIDFYENHK